jgi:hypothetical protein
MRTGEDNKKTTALGIVFKGSVTINGPMFDIHDNQHVHFGREFLPDEDEQEACEQAETADEVEPELPQAEELNYFAPAKMLKVMLQKDWFLDKRTDKKYSFEWIDGFVDALMASEWKTMIAQDWSHKDKRLCVRGYIIGTLSAAGVIKGSDLSISEAVTESDKKTVKTFAVYIGRGKKKPYFGWVNEYVNS